MKYILFVLFLCAVSKLSSQNVYDDIEINLERFFGTPNAVDSTLALHPDTCLNISQFLEKYDYPLEYHDVTTEDGYILTMHRIPHGKNEQIERQMANKTRPVMFLVHCLCCSSMDFIWQGPRNALAFLLADLGYDVWLANGRGNIYSMRHQTLAPDNPAFWDFSFHEKGYYDMPASVDYILNHTKLGKITYIGHSQGTTEALVMTSLRPEYNNKIDLFVFMSPIAYMEHLKSPMVILFTKYMTVLQLLFHSINIHGFAYSHEFRLITNHFCSEESIFQELCITIAGSIVGFDFPQVNKTTFTVYLANTPNGVSMKELYHFGQEIKSGYFRQYDYGMLGNMARYGSPSPPSYDIQKVTAPVVVYYSKNDYLAAVSDVERFLSELPNKPLEQYLIEYEQFNHLDFCTAKDVKTLLYDRLIGTLQKYIPVM